MEESTVSSKSRRYTINTSVIKDNINNNVTDFSDTIDNESLKFLIHKITFDVGRCDYSGKWMSVLAMAVPMIFLILTSVGPNLFYTSEKDNTNLVVEIIQYITEIIPSSSEPLILLIINLFLTFIYLAFIIFYYYTISRYKQSAFPSTTTINAWIFLTRCIAPFFTCYFSFLLWKGLRLILINADKVQSTIHFVFGLILCILHFFSFHLSDSIWQATPMIRKNDIGQLWFSYKMFNFIVQIIICLFVFMDQLCVMIGGLYGTIVFPAVVLVTTIISVVFLIRNLPFINPSPCSLFITIYIQCFVFSVNPFISVFVSKSITFIFVIDLIIFVILYFIGRLIVSKRTRSVASVFHGLHYEENEEEDQQELYALIAESKPKKQVDYSVLNIKRAYTAGLLMRIGFLYNIEDVTSLDFIKFVCNQFTDPRLYFSAAQISYALQTNLIYIAEVQKLCGSSGSQLANSEVFVQLLNELRQELLTQLNKPLLDGLHLAKKKNLSLQSVIGDFWGAVLKQKIEAMADHLSNITGEMIHAECAYQRLIRNFSNSPIVYRETTSFYNKTLGNHIKAMECHKLSKGKAKKEGKQSESNSTATDDVTTNNAQVDKAFAQRVEPSISAQEVFENMPSGPRNMLTTVYVFGFILSIICPIGVIAIGLIDMHSFTKTFEPVRVFSDTLYAVTRIPQLIRRYQLALNDQIIPWTPEIGPVRGTNLEFIPPSNCTPSLRKYVMQLRNLSVSILEVAKGNKDIERLSSSKIFNKKQSNSTTKSSSYDMLTTFTNAAEKLLNKTDDQWKLINTTDEVIFIFDNVDELVGALKQIMSITNQNVIKRRDEFKLKSIILYVVTWGFPFIIMLPLLFITIKNLKAEISFILKLFIGFPKNEISALRWSMKSSSSTKKGNKNATQAQQQTKVAFQSSIAGSSATTSVGSESSSVSFENREPAAEQVVDSLAASSRSHTGNYTRFVRFLLLFMLISSILTTIGIALYRSAMLSILNVAHGYVNAVDSTSTAVASYVWGQESFSKYPINNLSMKEVKTKTWSYVSEITNTFDNFLYSSENGMKASLLLGQDIINAYVTSTSINNVSDKYKPQHGFLHSVYFSLSCDTQLRLLWETSLFIMNASDPTEYSFDDNFTYQYEHLIFSHLDYCLKGGQNLLLSETDQIEKNQKYKMFLLFFSLFALQILVYFTIILVQFLRARAIHHTVHSLLLLIPPEALLKNQMVLKWISGSVDYTTYNRLRDTYKSKESSNIAHDFIVNNSKSGLILMDGDLKITQVNTTVCSMFKMESSQLQGMNFISVLNQQLMDKEKTIVVHQLEHDINKMKAGRARSNSSSIQSSILGANNQMMYLTITVVGHSVDDGAHDEDHESIVPATSFSVVVVDSTAEHFQAALVASEKAKGEKLIESLLPPSIIKRMNEGETDITFEVQQATVLFTSIVGWSNLTQDMKATQVMTILNSLFVAYDEELHNFPAITKMKTIGHIYMCCGGLFSDSSVNSGQVVVEYATKLLEIAQKVSKDLGISFQITCGVNTGGPIKCGILGVTRPVFDIIGDVVNVASRMNLHCLPGYVQISPSTYDAIKYLNFNVKERGEIQVKGKGMMKTYVVSANSNSQNSAGST